jgi:RNA polymerase sigma-70 factor (ECF subfamily)
MTFDELYNAEAEIATARMTQVLRSREDAEDVVAEAFAKLAQKGETSGGLLWKILADFSVNVLKRRVIELIAMRDLAVLTPGAGRTDGGIASIREAEARTDLTNALKSLPADELDAWQLTELRGLTVRDAADVIGVSYPTVSRRSESARLTLQKELT